MKIELPLTLFLYTVLFQEKKVNTGVKEVEVAWFPFFALPAELFIGRQKSFWIQVMTKFAQ